MSIRSITGVAVAWLGLLSLGASACTFDFSYDSIAAPIGTVGEVGVRVQKTHNKCTLASMNEYLIDGVGVQILGETSWVSLGGDVYEKWLQVSLSETGDGFLRISKECTKEGYQEESLPIAGLPADSPESLWAQAWGGTYPLDGFPDASSVVGTPVLEDQILTVNGCSVRIPSTCLLPEILPAAVRLFTTQHNGAPAALLLVGDGLFFRFDPYLL